jgi:membrane associated rhomboid family serine protease
MSEPPIESGLQPEESRREPLLNIPPVVVALCVICIAMHLIRVYLLDVSQDIELLLRAAFIPGRYFYQLDAYAFTTPFTYAFLHGSAAHLIVNLIWLAAFGSPLANRLGVSRFVLFWAVTGLAAVALHFAIHPHSEAPLIGASGAISGMMGAAARFAFRVDRSGHRVSFSGPVLPILHVLKMRMVATFLLVWMITNFVTGIYGMGVGSGMTIAWEAHVGGFVVGFFGISLFVPRVPTP